MSRVMKALERSEHSHQALSPTMTGYVAPELKTKTSGRVSSLVAIALLPPILVAGVMAFKTYQAEQAKWLKENVAQTVAVDVPFEYMLSDATQRNDLLMTTRPVNEPLEQTAAMFDSGADKPNSAPTNTAAPDFLEGLDLSELSPELAQRFESVLNTNPEAEQARDGDVSNLAHQSSRWYGKLPAMNFQTHVYSSKPDKRWVKINGTEFNQGDWIDDGIELVAIEQQSTLIRFQGELIEIPALYDWQG